MFYAKNYVPSKTASSSITTDLDLLTFMRLCWGKYCRHQTTCLALFHLNISF